MNFQTILRITACAAIAVTAQAQGNVTVNLSGWTETSTMPCPLPAVTNVATGPGLTVAASASPTYTGCRLVGLYADGGSPANAITAGASASPCVRTFILSGGFGGAVVSANVAPGFLTDNSVGATAMGSINSLADFICPLFPQVNGFVQMTYNHGLPSSSGGNSDFGISGGITSFMIQTGASSIAQGTQLNVGDSLSMSSALKISAMVTLN